MRKPGLGPEHSGSNDFYSDANLNLRATDATAADFAPGPNEDVSGILGVAAGLTPLRLSDVEVDDGQRGGGDVQGDYLSAPDPYPAGPPSAFYPPLPADDRVAALEAKLDRLTNLLLGDK